jgi:hypothetical protein
MWLGPDLGPNAFGNALGDSLAAANGQDSDNKRPSNDFARVDAVAAAAPKLGDGRAQDIDRSRDVLVASAAPNVVAMPGALPTITVRAGSDWDLGPEFDGISSLIDDLGDTANTAWQAYTGAADGAQGVIKDAVVGTASWVNDTLWQGLNIVSGGNLAKMTSQVEQAGYRQSQRTEALLGGLKSLSINGGLTIVDPVGQASRAWNALSAEAGRIGDAYNSGNVYGAFERGSRDLTNAALIAAPLVGPTTRVVGSMAETGSIGTRLAIGDLAASRTGQQVGGWLEQRAVAYAVEPGASAAAADAASTIGVPVTRSANPLSPVLEFDAHGNEIMYRSMSPADFEHLQNFGVLRPTTETSISPNLAYSSKYTNNNSVTVRFATEPGTSAALQEIGIAANPPAAQALGLAERNGGWMQTNTRFKVEGGQMTTQLGQGPGIATFNRGIVDFERVR